jgi:replication factor C small subunit
MREIEKLWSEKYRPTTVDEYVFHDKAQERQVKNWVKEKSIPHLLFSGSAGVGKTTLAKILLNELNIGEYDILEINASRTNNVDTVRDTIINFVQMIPFGDFKVVLLDEADFLTPSAQAILRGVMETYSDHSRFILTCNYPHRILPALHSRCQGFHFVKGDQDEFTARLGDILYKEGIELTEETINALDVYVKLTFPDFRKCINRVQQNVFEGTLMLPLAGDNDTADYRIEMIDLFKKGKYYEARTLLCGRVLPEEIEEIYNWMYQNITLFGDTAEKQDSAVVIIKQGIVDHTFSGDGEVNLAAVLIKLMRNYHS